MFRISRGSIVSSLLLAALVATTWASEAPIREWVEQVGSEDNAAAWRARQDLVRAGESAVGAILDAIENDGLASVHRKTLGIVLGEIRSPRANERLMRCFETAQDPLVREGILEGLMGQDSPEVRTFLEGRIAGEEDESLRTLAIRNLAETQDIAFLPRAVDLLQDESDFVREYAIRAIGKYPEVPEELLPSILAHLAREPDEMLRADLVAILLEAGPRDAVMEALKQHLTQESSPEIRQLIISHVGPTQAPLLRPNDNPQAGIVTTPEEGTRSLPLLPAERSRTTPHGGEVIASPTPAGLAAPAQEGSGASRSGVRPGLIVLVGTVCVAVLLVWARLLRRPRGPTSP